VYHAAAGAPPILSRIPIVVTLLDLAPWELPATFQRTPASRFGQRLRAQLIRDAGAVLVGSEAIAAKARRLLRLRARRVRVVPFAAHPTFASARSRADDRRGVTAPPEDDRVRLGLPDRFLVYFGRFDARHDVATLLRALAALAIRHRPHGLPLGAPWPPRLLIVGASPEDRAALARAAGRLGGADSLVYAPALPTERLASLVRESRAVVMPAISDAAGLPALDAIAAGVPVIATAVGALPEAVGGAGILVEPRDPARLAEALHTAWADERVHARLVDAAIARATASARSWTDVAWDTRRVYAQVGRRDLE
jgi:glycosyltransferase involved in cell wall biosynthesis